MASSTVDPYRPGMRISQSVEGGEMVLALTGEFDIAARPDFARVVALVIAREQRDIVVDASKLEFIDASGVGALVRTSELLSVCGRGLRLRAPTRQVARVLALTHLEGLVRDHPMPVLR
ncbi:MAG: STAS domain-containing protein [Acidimicrobiales bacterium]